jgi:hypothetical protein
MVTMNQDEAERGRHALIEKRAYEIYEARGREPGMDEEDWLRAEAEVDRLPIEDLLPELGDQDEGPA